MRMPTKKPRIDATNPVIAASTSTDVITWARVAPSARNSASSRVRCATRMLNVLMMRKLPTNSEMNAKTSSGVPMNVLIVELGALLRGRRRLLPGLCHRVTRQGRGDVLPEHDVGHAALRADKDAVVLVLPFQDPFRGRLGEQRDGCAGQVVGGPVPREAGDREVFLDASEEHDRQRLSNREPILCRCARIDHDVSRLCRCGAAAQAIRRDRTIGDPVGAECRRTVAADRLPVVADQRGALAKETAHRCLNTGNGANGGEQRGGNWMVLAAADTTALSRDRAAVHSDRDARIRRREDARKRRVDRVGEDERSRDERDAEDDRNRGEREPQLVRKQASQADADHRSAPDGGVSHRDDA